MKVLDYAIFLPNEENMKSLQLPASLKRRAPRIWKIAYAAASQIVSDEQIPEAIVCGTALGALDETVSFMDKIYTSNMGSPRQFIASVHNSMAGVLAMEFKSTGSNMTLCESHNSLAAALATAEVLPESKVLVVLVDEQLPFLDSVYEQCENSTAFTGAPQEGAFAILLDTDSSDTPALKGTAPAPADGSFTGSFFSPGIELFNALEAKESAEIESYSPTAQCKASISLSYE